jgi:hypothetical protein
VYSRNKSDLLLVIPCRYGEWQAPEGDQHTISNMLLINQATPLNSGYNISALLYYGFSQVRGVAGA